MGLAVAYYYMFKNECLLLTPLSAVRFSVLIAKQEKDFQEIKEWVQLHTAHNYEEYRRKSYELITKPMAEWLLLYRQATRENDQTAIQNANDIMDNWLARDIYPEY